MAKRDKGPTYAVNRKTKDMALLPEKMQKTDLIQKTGKKELISSKAAVKRAAEDVVNKQIKTGDLPKEYADKIKAAKKLKAQRKRKKEKPETRKATKKDFDFSDFIVDDDEDEQSVRKAARKAVQERFPSQVKKPSTPAPRASDPRAAMRRMKALLGR